jgi:hypothetical protein
MKNVKNSIGIGFKVDKPLFGVSINNYSCYKFSKKGSEEIAVALVDNRKDKVCDDEKVYRFENQDYFQNWMDEMYEGGLHYQDGNLLARAYPCLLPTSSHDEYI